MIEIVEGLRIKLTAIRRHLLLLARPDIAEQSFDGISAVRDAHDEIIPGALCYATGADGPDVAILGGIHMNEMSGVYALLKFHARWLNGVRPKCGNIFVATGQIERALEFIETVIGAENVSPDIWSDFHATRDHFNYNRIPFDILTKKISTDFERHALQIVRHILQPTRGNILDLHNTSVDAAPMVTMFMHHDETPEMIISRINATGVIEDFPIRDFIVWKPGPYNGVESIRSIVDTETGCMPILVENGGGANPASFDAADIHTQVWLKNVIGMKPEDDVAGRQSISIERNYYVETHALYHPDVKPEDYSHLDQETLEEVKKDTFVLIRDWRSANAITGWSDKARQALNRLEQKNYSKNRLDNFRPIKKGALLAIGLNSGLELRSPVDGVVMMVGASTIVVPENRETFANIGIKWN
ncbi:MAG: hypothetical protein O6703_07470 [Gammaproteobacteria bacterium]|nr:hypothetical protein [Gammaproteobacteria bacterium]